jgi:aspartyl-tRNA(Asn)/glutamyl-tRNA(Gln) amidotransferase subunit A
MDTPYYLTAHDAARLLRDGEIAARELTEAVLKRIHEVDDRVKAYVTVTEDIALRQADEADARIARGEGAALTGIPVCVKDVICTKGIRTTCGSRMLENFVPPYDAFVSQRLLDAGAVIVGKANMDEFAMGSSTENSAFFPTHNPWDLERVPGGSSGGSAAAAAAGECTVALGSDTGGSIRQPGAFCGVVGLKPTYGRVSRFGLVAFASSLDQIGPLTRDVEDAAILLNCIGGYDPCDSTSANVEMPDFTRSLEKDLRGMKIGIPKEYLPDEMDPAVRQSFDEAVRVMESLGASVVRGIALPTTPYALAVYYIIAPSEAMANLARYDGVKYGYSFQEGEGMWDNMERTRQYGFGDEVKRRIMLGTFALSAGYYDAYYLKAQKVRTLIRREFDEAFKRCDVLVTPVTPTPAFRIGEKVDDPYAMYLNDIFTLPVNIAGLPGISVPVGFCDGLPVGVQVLAKPFDEGSLFRVAYAYEQATDWHKAHPPL